MRKYKPVPLPKHWLTTKKEKQPYEFSTDSAIGVLLGPLSLVYLNPGLAIGLSFIDIFAIMLLVLSIKYSFFSLSIIISGIVILFINHYLCNWLRTWMLERRK